MKYLIIVFLMLGMATQAIAGGNKIYTHHNQNVVQVKEKVVEFDARTFLGLDGYYAHIDNLRQQSIEKEEINAETINKLLDLIKVLIENQNKNGGNIPLPPIPTPTPEPKEPEKPANDLDSKVFTIFKRDCANCHSDSNASGGLKLVGKDEQGEFLYNIPWYSKIHVHDRTLGVGLADRGLKRMPIGGPPLSDEDVETLRQWMVKSADEAKTKAKEEIKE